MTNSTCLLRTVLRCMVSESGHPTPWNSPMELGPLQTPASCHAAVMLLLLRGWMPSNGLCFSAGSPHIPGLRPLQVGFCTPSTDVRLTPRLCAYLPTMLQKPSLFLHVAPRMQLPFAKQINILWHSIGDQIPSHLLALTGLLVLIRILF